MAGSTAATARKRSRGETQTGSPPRASASEEAYEKMGARASARSRAAASVAVVEGVGKKSKLQRGDEDKTL